MANPSCVFVNSWCCAQYCDGGPLDRAVRQGRFAGDLASIYLCLMDIAAGMTYLHSLGIVHRRAPARMLNREDWVRFE